jgi:hypothetical protein
MSINSKESTHENSLIRIISSIWTINNWTEITKVIQINNRLRKCLQIVILLIQRLLVAVIYQEIRKENRITIKFEIMEIFESLV